VYSFDKFGTQSSYPQKIRQNLGLQPGEMVQLEESGENVILKPGRQEEALVFKDGVLVFTETLKAILPER
jgi:bifunctional DNA-binding transcriptional regulator/antitoxin component of YhaV-PrlF toxin-antitoxin module